MYKDKKFEKNSIVLFVMMMVANVCNYIFQIIMGNILKVEDFGIVNTLLAFITIISIPSTILMLVSARYIAIGYTLKEDERIYSVMHILKKITMVIIFSIAIIGVVASEKIGCFLKIDNTILVFISILVAMITITNAMLNGFLQGMQKFASYGIQTVILAAGKLIGSIILVFLGLKILGVLIALCMAGLIAIIYCIVSIKPYLKGFLHYKGNLAVDLKEMSIYIRATVVIQIVMVLLTNCDILVVKYFFTSEETGLYSSVMVLGKIAMYVAGAVVTALFPMVVEAKEKGENTESLLLKALLYGGGAAVICGIGMLTLGQYVIPIVFGEKYVEAIFLLPAICVYIIPLTFLTIIMNYVLALGKTTFFSTSVLLGGLIILVGIYLRHETIQRMLMVAGIGIILLCIINLFNIRNTSKIENKQNDILID